jgi:ribosomal protein L31E
MKVKEFENIKLGKYLNLELWKHGIKNPPSRVKVNVTKDDKGVVTAELFGTPKEEKKVEAPKKKAETKLTDVKAATAEAAKQEDKKPAALQATKTQTGQIVR